MLVEAGRESSGVLVETASEARGDLVEPAAEAPGALVEYQRFTVAEVNAGLADGWTFASGWHATPGSAGPWAWFKREVRTDG